jgi:ABC-type bacteriocin/lantibiotic exporter with double-glycine peptidase domain
MPRTTNRSPEERFLFARRVLVGGAAFEIVACIALLFLLRWPMNVIVVVVAIVMLGSYNVLFWRIIKKEAAEQKRSNASDLF